MRVAGRLAVSALFAWASLEAQGAPGRPDVVEPVHVVRGAYAEVMGDDPEVVAGVAFAFQLVARAAQGVLEMPDAFPTPVYVRIVQMRGLGQPPYALDSEPGGLVSLRLRAGAEGEGGKDWRRGVAESFLLRWGFFQFGARQDVVVPAWLLAAFEARAEAEEEPAVGDWLLAQARPAGPAPLAALLTAAPGEVAREQAYVLLRLLVLQPDGRRRLTGLVRDLLAGVEPRTAFLAQYGDLPALESGAQEFWIAGFFDLASRRSGPLLSAPASREAVLDLGRVRVRADGTARLATPREIWRMRQRPPMRKLALARWRTARAVLLDAHPFYFNGALSAGRAYEALLHHRYTSFRQAWSAYAADLAMGDRLEAETAAAVAAWDERLRPAP